MAPFYMMTIAGGAVPLGLAAGVAAGLYAPRLFHRLSWNEGQIRTAGAASVWGGVIGGFFADSVKTQGTSAAEVLAGASIGATAGALGGALFARKATLTRGDVALIDTLAGIGAAGGLTIGMLMQPAETEAYSVNAIIGTSAGVVVGLLPRLRRTPRSAACCGSPASRRSAAASRSCSTRASTIGTPPPTSA